MSCNCNICNESNYTNTSLEMLIALKNDLLAIIESLEKKDIRNTLDHYRNVLKIVQKTINHYNPME